MLPSENRVIRFLEFLTMSIVAGIIGLVIAAISMSLGCTKTVVVREVMTPDENETWCIHEASDRILASASCQEAVLKILSLGVKEPRCSELFKANSGLMNILTCEESPKAPSKSSLSRTNESNLVSLESKADTAPSSSKAADMGHAFP